MHKEDDLKFLKKIVNIIPQYVFWKDENSKFLGCNASFAKLVNLTKPEQIVGKTDYDLPWNKEESDNYCQDDRLIIKSRKPKLFYEEKQSRVDGIEHTVLVSKIPVKLNNDSYGLVCIYQDITDRKKKEQAEISSKSK